jgi:hypothetical protein
MDTAESLEQSLSSTRRVLAVALQRQQRLDEWKLAEYRAGRNPYRCDVEGGTFVGGPEGKYLGDSEREAREDTEQAQRAVNNLDMMLKEERGEWRGW